MNFAKFLRTPFFQNTLRRQLLDLWHYMFHKKKLICGSSILTLKSSKISHILRNVSLIYDLINNNQWESIFLHFTCLITPFYITKFWYIELSSLKTIFLPSGKKVSIYRICNSESSGEKEKNWKFSLIFNSCLIFLTLNFVNRLQFLPKEHGVIFFWPLTHSWWMFISYRNNMIGTSVMKKLRVNYISTCISTELATGGVL